MNDHFTYGFAALGSESVYPRFREGHKLDFIPVDFLLPEELGFQLMLFLEQSNLGWERASTTSEMMIIDGLITTYAEPKTKVVNTYTSVTRTPLVGDGLVMVMATTCHVASAAVVKQLLPLAVSIECFAKFADAGLVGVGTRRKRKRDEAGSVRPCWPILQRTARGERPCAMNPRRQDPKYPGIVGGDDIELVIGAHVCSKKNKRLVLGRFDSNDESGKTRHGFT